MTESRLVRALLRAASAVVLAFLYLPLIVLGVYAFNESRIASWPPTGFTLHWFTEAFARDDMLAAIAQLNEARAALLSMAEKHPNAIVPAYTWGVQAQPITFGHWVLGYTQALARAAERGYLGAAG